MIFKKNLPCTFTPRYVNVSSFMLQILLAGFSFSVLLGFMYLCSMLIYSEFFH